MLSLPQCLLLELIKLGNPKYTRSGDLRKVLGVPLGSSTSEDSSFGASHSRATPPVATEDIKRIKESVQDTRKMVSFGSITIGELHFPCMVVTSMSPNCDFEVAKHKFDVCSASRPRLPQSATSRVSWPRPAHYELHP
ncbi:hypothetical protein ACFE04_009969 [Oxalis oulophora]